MILLGVVGQQNWGSVIKSHWESALETPTFRHRGCEGIFPSALEGAGFFGPTIVGVI